MKLPKRVLAKKNATRSLPGIGISFCFLQRKERSSMVWLICLQIGLDRDIQFANLKRQTCAGSNRSTNEQASIIMKLRGT
jgi:hypothetical protein